MWQQRHLLMASSEHNEGYNNGDRPRRLTVETIDNHIYFYADVDSDRCLALMREVRETDSELRSQHLSRGLEGQPMTPIWLHIHSYGGSLFTAFSVADQLAMIKSPIYGIVEGVCASAATLIVMSCQKRYILPNSFMLIHQLSSFMWGTHEEFKDEMDLQEQLMERLVEFYAKHTNLSRKKLRQMLKRDFWMDAETSIEHRFVDEMMR
ncbi:MAG: Clp protease ClpP [Chloroflexi bacterium]|nr:MAG: Clp protease ClpP [Chloroflexota bacterium]